MEIERKFLIRRLPEDLEQYPFRLLEQGYLNTDPVVRVRKEDDDHYLTYKGKGFLAREEYNLPLNKEAYEHLLPKADGNIISKKRYLIPIEGTALTIELDIFEGKFEGTVIAEVEFDSVEAANAFTAPDWFGADVTKDRRYSNSYMSCSKSL
jgi:CYTH domain-containing protein